MDTDQSIARAIQVRMLRLGISQKELADMAGINEATLSSYMSGKVKGGWKIALLDKLSKPLKWAGAIDVSNAAAVELSEYEKLAA